MHGKAGKIIGRKNIEWGSCIMKKQHVLTDNEIVDILIDYVDEQHI